MTALSLAHSIGLRLIRWRHRLLDQVAKHSVQGLHRSEIHADARADHGLRFGVCVNDALRKGDVYRPVELSRFANEINVGHGSIIPSNNPSLVSYLEGVRFDTNHASLAHQASPVGSSADFGAVNLRLQDSGVEA